MENELIDKFKDALKTNNMKFTPQRLSILQEVVESKEHRECDEIYMSLKEQNQNVSRATVYRTMDFLVDNDFARKIDIGDGKSRYETKINHPHHDHMICVDTGKIIEFVSPEIEQIQDEIAEQKGYKIIKHVHQLFVKKISWK